MTVDNSKGGKPRVDVQIRHADINRAVDDVLAGAALSAKWATVLRKNPTGLRNRTLTALDVQKIQSDVQKVVEDALAHTARQSIAATEVALNAIDRSNFDVFLQVSLDNGGTQLIRQQSFNTLVEAQRWAISRIGRDGSELPNPPVADCPSLVADFEIRVRDLQGGGSLLTIESVEVQSFLDAAGVTGETPDLTEERVIAEVLDGRGAYLFSVSFHRDGAWVGNEVVFTSLQAAVNFLHTPTNVAAGLDDFLITVHPVDDVSEAVARLGREDLEGVDKFAEEMRRYSGAAPEEKRSTEQIREDVLAGNGDYTFKVSLKIMDEILGSSMYYGCEGREFSQFRSAVAYARERMGMSGYSVVEGPEKVFMSARDRVVDFRIAVYENPDAHEVLSLSREELATVPTHDVRPDIKETVQAGFDDIINRIQAAQKSTNSPGSERTESVKDVLSTPLGEAFVGAFKNFPKFDIAKEFPGQKKSETSAKDASVSDAEKRARQLAEQARTGLKGFADTVMHTVNVADQKVDDAIFGAATWADRKKAQNGFTTTKEELRKEISDLAKTKPSSESDTGALLSFLQEELLTAVENSPWTTVHDDGTWEISKFESAPKFLSWMTERFTHGTWKLIPVRYEGDRKINGDSSLHSTLSSAYGQFRMSYNNVDDTVVGYAIELRSNDVVVDGKQVPVLSLSRVY